MPPKAKAAPRIQGLEGKDIAIRKSSFRVGPQIGAGGFGQIFLGARG